MNVSKFIQGMIDCDNGKDAELNECDDYYRGYSERYAMEQIQTHNTEKQGEKNVQYLGRA